MAPDQAPRPASRDAGDHAHLPQQDTQGGFSISPTELSLLATLSRTQEDRRLAATRVTGSYEALMSVIRLVSGLPHGRTDAQALRTYSPALLDISNALRDQQEAIEQSNHARVAYRTWQENQARPVGCGSQPSQENASAPGPFSEAVPTRAAPVIVTTPTVTPQQQPRRMPTTGVQYLDAPNYGPFGLSLLASMGPVDDNDSDAPSPDACCWQTEDALDGIRLHFNRHGGRRRATTAHPDYQAEVPPALRQLFLESQQRLLASSASGATAPGSPQMPGQDRDGSVMTDSTETGDLQRGSPSLVGDETCPPSVDSSEPQTPDAEQAVEILDVKPVSAASNPLEEQQLHLA